jgi:hypothetical protein
MMWRERLAELRTELEGGDSALTRERRARVEAEARSAELTAMLEAERHARQEAEARAEAAGAALMQAHTPSVRLATRQQRHRRFLPHLRGR